MSNIDKRPHHADGGDIGTGRIKEIADNPYGDEEKCWLAKRVLALLDELEAKDRNWAAQDDHINQQADLIESLEKKNGDLGRALGAAEKRIAELTEALRQSVIGYKSCLHMGHDRILDLGGDCDAPEVMIAGNPDIQQAEKLLAAGTAKGE